MKRIKLYSVVLSLVLFLVWGIVTLQAHLRYSSDHIGVLFVHHGETSTMSMCNDEPFVVKIREAGMSRVVESQFSYFTFTHCLRVKDLPIRAGTTSKGWYGLMKYKSYTFDGVGIATEQLERFEHSRVE